MHGSMNASLTVRRSFDEESSVLDTAKACAHGANLGIEEGELVKDRRGFDACER